MSTATTTYDTARRTGWISASQTAGMPAGRFRGCALRVIRLPLLRVRAH